MQGSAICWSIFSITWCKVLALAYEMQQCNTTQPKTNMTMEKQPFEDVFPILHMWVSIAMFFRGEQIFIIASISIQWALDVSYMEGRQSTQPIYPYRPSMTLAINIFCHQTLDAIRHKSYRFPESKLNQWTEPQNYGICVYKKIWNTNLNSTNSILDLQIFKCTTRFPMSLCTISRFYRSIPQADWWTNATYYNRERIRRGATVDKRPGRWKKRNGWRWCFFRSNNVVKRKFMVWLWWNQGILCHGNRVSQCQWFWGGAWPSMNAVCLVTAESNSPRLQLVGS